MRGNPPPASSFQVMPPSTDLYMDVPVGLCARWPPPPPPKSPPGGTMGAALGGGGVKWRTVVANTTSGRSNAIASFWMPVESSTNNVRAQLLPPLVERKTPRSSLLWRTSPCAATSTTFASRGSTTMLGICFVFSRPIRVHVAPASLLLYMPLPSAIPPPVIKSPVPTYIVLPLDGATSTAPITSASFTLSKIGHQVAPALVVFHTPPAGMPM